jgi:stringent starvation protein B
MMNASGASSTRPYLIRALYEWCGDNGLTPYVAVRVDDTVRVPREYVKDGEIVLNISMDATSGLKLGNDYIEFKARFAGVARDIMIPVGRVMAIYARESGQGMAFPLEEEGLPGAADQTGVRPGEASPGSAAPPDPSGADAGALDGNAAPEPPKPGGGPTRPALKRVK